MLRPHQFAQRRSTRTHSSTQFIMFSVPSLGGGGQLPHGFHEVGRVKVRIGPVRRLMDADGARLAVVPCLTDPDASLTSVHRATPSPPTSSSPVCSSPSARRHTHAAPTARTMTSTLRPRSPAASCLPRTSTASTGHTSTPATSSSTRRARRIAGPRPPPPRCVRWGGRARGAPAPPGASGPDHRRGPSAAPATPPHRSHRPHRRRTGAAQCRPAWLVR